jgi:hypothetical protein
MACGMALAAQPASAQPPAAWADPTRPAAALAGDAPASAPRPTHAASAAAAPAAPRLQSIQSGADGFANALVDGRLVQVGDALGAWRVAAIEPDGLTLRDAKGRAERLALIPAAIVKRDGGSARPLADTPPSARPLAAASERPTRREGRQP